MNLDRKTTTHYTNQREVYTSEPLRKDRYGRTRVYDSPGKPRGAEMRLAEWIDENKEAGKTRAWLATEMSVHAATVDAWCNGRRKPSLEKILKIEELTNGAVTAHDWITLAK